MIYQQKKNKSGKEVGESQVEIEDDVPLATLLQQVKISRL
jgi:hypothetical protein